MKKLLQPRLLPVITLAATAVGILLRLWSVTCCVDERGLLNTGHISVILSFLLTAAYMAYLFFAVRSVTGLGSYRQLFPAHPFPAAGCVAAAVGAVVCALNDTQQGVLHILLLVTGILAALCLLALGVLRFLGRRPLYLLRSVVTVFFIVLLVCQYRAWIRETQFAVYFFPLLACVFLMLTAYHGAELDAKKTQRKHLIFCNRAALFFCGMSLWGENRLFYLTMLLWLATGLCSVKPLAPSEPEV